MAKRTPKKKAAETKVDPFGDALPEPGMYELAPQVGQEKLPARQIVDKRKLAVDWRVLESEYVYGWLNEDPETNLVKRIYPTMSDLARRHGINKGTIGRYAKDGNWFERRQLYIAQLRREIDQEVARARSLSLTELNSGLDGFLSNFLIRMAGNGVENTKITDFDKACRLKVWLAKEMQGLMGGDSDGVSLEDLQRAHGELEKQAQGLSESTAGVIPSRAQREATRDAEADGTVSVLSEARSKRDTKAAKDALASLKRSHRTGWDVCDTLSA